MDTQNSGLVAWAQQQATRREAIKSIGAAALAGATTLTVATPPAQAQHPNARIASLLAEVIALIHTDTAVERFGQSRVTEPIGDRWHDVVQPLAGPMTGLDNCHTFAKLLFGLDYNGSACQEDAQNVAAEGFAIAQVFTRNVCDLEDHAASTTISILFKAVTMAAMEFKDSRP